jgi:hypothetical protein
MDEERRRTAELLREAENRAREAAVRAEEVEIKHKGKVVCHDLLAGEQGNAFYPKVTNCIPAWDVTIAQTAFAFKSIL